MWTRLSWSVLVLLAIALFGSTYRPVDNILPSVPKAHAASLSFALVGYAATGWNGSNPSITVSPGDSVNVALSSGDGAPHRFVVDVDLDGKTSSPTCPPDKCSSAFPPSTTYPFTVDFAARTYTYYCAVHPNYMFGNFIVQASATPNFALTANPAAISSLNAGTQGTSTITVTPSNGFAGTVTLS